MAKAYDYFWTGRVLVAAGANESLKNHDGHAACDGIDGDTGGVNFIAALTSAHTTVQLMEALDGILTQSDVDKSELVMGGMQKKRSAKALWTPEIDAKFKTLCKRY
jgi:hypothetical protein